MELISNKINNKYLESFLPTPDANVNGVVAAIAYGNDINEKFIRNCLDNKYRLDIWMRYDHTVPVAVPLLKKLLKHHRDNIFCKLIPDYLHSKVIWWHGYGAYIGSANLTDRAWMRNIEAGVFLSDSDLQDTGMAIELEIFFDELRVIDQSFNLTQEVISEMEAIQAKRKGLADIGKDLRKTPVWDGPAAINAVKAKDRRKENFRKEWHDALTILRSIGDQLIHNRPEWVDVDIPIEWQIDQFLHAFYYNKVGEGNSKPFEDYFQANRHDPKNALNREIAWWASTSEAPSHEDHTFYVSAPYIREHLRKDKILSLSEDEFTNVCKHTHATKDHVIKMKLAKLGRPDLSNLNREGRLHLYSKWLLRERNNKGWSVLQLLDYVLYGGQRDDTWERLYIASRDNDYVLPHYGLNSMAELVGWAQPETAPPRNGRTSKALRAFGYDVKIY